VPSFTNVRPVNNASPHPEPGSVGNTEPDAPVRNTVLPAPAILAPCSHVNEPVTSTVAAPVNVPPSSTKLATLDASEPLTTSKVPPRITSEPSTANTPPGSRLRSPSRPYPRRCTPHQSSSVHAQRTSSSSHPTSQYHHPSKCLCRAVQQTRSQRRKPARKHRTPPPHPANDTSPAAKPATQHSDPRAATYRAPKLFVADTPDTIARNSQRERAVA